MISVIKCMMVFYHLMITLCCLLSLIFKSWCAITTGEQCNYTIKSNYIMTKTENKINLIRFGVQLCFPMGQKNWGTRLDLVQTVPYDQVKEEWK